MTARVQALSLSPLNGSQGVGFWGQRSSGAPAPGENHFSEPRTAGGRPCSGRPLVASLARCGPGYSLVRCLPDFLVLRDIPEILLQSGF